MSTSRPSRTIEERFATYPYNGRILEYYAGVFESVYVMLHPFVRPTSLSREQLFQPYSLSWAETIAGCEPVRWEEARVAAGLPSIAAVGVALLTGIRALSEPHRNDTYEAQLDAAMAREGWIEPGEGNHADLLIRPMLDVFDELGHSFVWLANESAGDRICRDVQSLKKERHTSFYRRNCVFSHDHTLLWAVHWDMHFAFLCGSRAELESVRVAERFEGFWCDENTDVVWCLPE